MLRDFFLDFPLTYIRNIVGGVVLIVILIASVTLLLKKLQFQRTNFMKKNGHTKIALILSGRAF